MAGAAGNAGALAARARIAERKQNEAMESAPVNQLQRAAGALDAAEWLLGTAADGGISAAKWGEFRDVLAPGMVEGDVPPCMPRCWVVLGTAPFPTVSDASSGAALAARL